MAEPMAGASSGLGWVMTLLPGNAQILVATDDVQQILLEPHQGQFSSVVRRLLCNGYYIDKYIKRE